MLKDGRTRHGWTQLEAAGKAGVSRTEWSTLELGRRPATFWAVNRAAHALGSNLSAYLDQVSAADVPRDAVQLRNAELLIVTAKPGGWLSLPEAQLDSDARKSRWVDVLLERRHRHAPTEYCACEIWDWLADVGSATRDFVRRLQALDRYGVARMQGDDPVPRVSGFWLLRATKRNRELVAQHQNFFHDRFPGSGRAWLAALADPAAPMPDQPALLWVSVRGDRLFASPMP
jgi:transcriptional regulator with XRE-family HTH domain